MKENVDEKLMDHSVISMDEMRKVWAARAARLAHVPLREEEGSALQYVPLKLGQEVYAVEVQYVADIRPLVKLTRVPRVPPWVAGVVNLRGRIYSVVDLLKFLGLPRDPGAAVDQHEIPQREEGVRYLVVVETPALELALLVDEVLPIQNLLGSRIEKAVDRTGVAQLEYVYGIADLGDGDPMVILDLPLLLADKQLIIHEELG